MTLEEFRYLVDIKRVYEFEYKGKNYNLRYGCDEKGEYLYWCYRAPSAAEAAENEAQDFLTMQKGKYSQG